MAKPVEQTKPFSRVRDLLALEKKDINVIIFLTFGAGILSLATPIAVQTLVNIVTMGGATQPLLLISFMLFVLLVFSGGLNLFEYYVVELIQRRVFVRTTLQTAANAQAMHISVRDSENTVELMNRFFDVTTVQKACYQLLTKGLAAVLQLVVGSIVLMFYSFYFTLTVVFLLIMAWLIIAVIGRIADQTAISESYAKYDSAAWLESIGRNLTLFKFGKSQTYATQRADMLANLYLERRKKHFSTLFKQNLAATFTYASAGTIMLGLGGWLVMQGQINLGQFIAAELIIFGALAAFIRFTAQLEYLYDLMAGLDKLAVLKDLPSERVGGHDVHTATAYSVTAVDVALPATQSQSLVNLHVASGKSLAILIDTDDAKSSLAELLLGLRTPLSGVIRMNDIDMRQIDLNAMRQHVAYLQNVETIEDSILNNLTLHHPATSLQQVQQVLKQLGLDEAINALPEGLDTGLLPSGAPLTNLQARVLMVARALLTQPKLIVVDSLLDSLHGEELETVCQALKSDINGWTLIVVTALPGISNRLDAIYELDKHP
jgi:ABC-type bacteriocin/lantibiotic exporter with double-glycine peptidase domain